MVITKLLKILRPKKDLHIRLSEEDMTCFKFANYLRELTLEKNFPYIWFHVPNQIAIGSKGSSKNSYRPIFGLKQSWMGRIPGTPDYCFIGKESFFIEFKSKVGKQSEAQKIFEEWCKSKNIKYYLCRSFEEGKKIILTAI